MIFNVVIPAPWRFNFGGGGEAHAFGEQEETSDLPQADSCQHVKDVDAPAPDAPEAANLRRTKELTHANGSALL